MLKLGFIAGALALLSAPVLAGPAVTDKPIVVAEEGVSVRVGGDHDRDRDRDHHHHVLVVHHHDEEEHHHHHVVVIHHGDDDHH